MSQTFPEPIKYRPRMSPAEIMTVAGVAARYFNGNLERALMVKHQTGSIPRHRCLSVSRFNRPLPRSADLSGFCLQTLLEMGRTGEAFILDSEPVAPEHDWPGLTVAGPAAKKNRTARRKPTRSPEPLSSSHNNCWNESD